MILSQNLLLTLLILWILSAVVVVSGTGRSLSFFGRIPPTGQKYGEHDIVPHAILTDPSNISHISFQSSQQKSIISQNTGSRSEKPSPFVRLQNVPSLFSYFFRPLTQPTRSPFTFNKNSRPSFSFFRTTTISPRVSASSPLLRTHHQNERDGQKLIMTITSVNDQTFTTTTTRNVDISQSKDKIPITHLPNQNNDNNVIYNVQEMAGTQSVTKPSAVLTKNEEDSTTTENSNATLVRTPRQNDLMDGFTDDELSDLPPLPQVNEDYEEDTRQISSTTSTTTTTVPTTVKTTTTSTTTPRTTTKTTSTTTPRTTTTTTTSTTTRPPSTSTVPPARVTTSQTPKKLYETIILETPTNVAVFNSSDSEELRDLPPLADFPEFDEDYTDADQAINFTPVTTTQKIPVKVTTDSSKFKEISGGFPDLPKPDQNNVVASSAKPPSPKKGVTQSSVIKQISPNPIPDVDQEEFADLPPLPSGEDDAAFDDGEDLSQFIREKFSTTSKPVSSTTTTPSTTTRATALPSQKSSSAEETGSAKEDYGDLAPVPVSEEEYYEPGGNVNVPNIPSSTRAPVTVRTTTRRSTTTTTTTKTTAEPKFISNPIESGPPFPPGPDELDEEEDQDFNFDTNQQQQFVNPPTRPTTPRTTTRTTTPRTTTKTTTTRRPVTTKPPSPIPRQQPSSESPLLPESEFDFSPSSEPPRPRPILPSSPDSGGHTNTNHFANELQRIRDSLQNLFASFTPPPPPVPIHDTRQSPSPVNHFFNIHIGTINLNSGDRSHVIYNGPDPHALNPKRDTHPEARPDSSSNDGDSSSSQSVPVPSTSVMLSVGEGKKDRPRPTYNSNQPIRSSDNFHNSDLPPMLNVDSSEFDDIESSLPGSIKTIEGGPPIPLAPLDDEDDLADFPPSHGIVSAGNFDFNVRAKPVTATKVTPFNSGRAFPDKPPLPIYSEDDSSDSFVDRSSGPVTRNQDKQTSRRTGRRKISDGRRR